MKIRLFTIPNIITLLNLMCGAIATVEITQHGNLNAAFWLVIIAAAFDFLDGMTARLFSQYSAIGAELDSLADMISFGLVPSLAMFSLFEMGDKAIACPEWVIYGGYTTFIIAAFSALRLAKFNIDTEQKTSFTGMPTPANALFCMSLGMLTERGMLALSAETVAVVSVVMALLLILPIKMIALKFKSLKWRENRLRYILIGLSIASIATLKLFAIPAIIVIYIAVSTVGAAIDKRLNSRDIY